MYFSKSSRPAQVAGYFTIPAPGGRICAWAHIISPSRSPNPSSRRSGVAGRKRRACVQAEARGRQATPLTRVSP